MKVLAFALGAIFVTSSANAENSISLSIDKENKDKSYVHQSSDACTENLGNISGVSLNSCEYEVLLPVVINDQDNEIKENALVRVSSRFEMPDNIVKKKAAKRFQALLKGSGDIELREIVSNTGEQAIEVRMVHTTMFVVDPKDRQLNIGLSAE